MNSAKILALALFCLIASSAAFAQPNDKVIHFNQTFSNRTTNGVNNGLEPKSWTFFDMTSFDTKYYNGNVTKPGYREGYLSEPWGSLIMNFRLQYPENYNPGENYDYPMIVMMHGAGERANCWNGDCYFDDYNITAVTNGGNITSGSNLLNSATANFTINHLNKEIWVNGVGPSGAVLKTYITSVNSSTQVTLANSASSTATNRTFSYGYGSSNQYWNNDLQLAHGGLAHMDAVYKSQSKKAEDPTLDSKAFPGFVLFPQAMDGWFDTPMLNVTQIIDQLVYQLHVDPDRIYIHGLSNGGGGVWGLLNMRPDLFAGVLPMSAVISYDVPVFNANVDKTIRVPAWMFQGGTDTSPSPATTNQILDKLRTAGGTPRFTYYPTLGHGTWTTAYAEPDFFTWILSKNKSDIQIAFGSASICTTNGTGAKLMLGTGFLAYQWEFNGVVIPGAYTATYVANNAGTYRARFSRISATPSEEQWNQWSKPLVVTESTPAAPVLTTTISPHLPDINAGDYVFRIDGPTTANLTKKWYENGSLLSGETNTYFSRSIDAYHSKDVVSTSTFTLITTGTDGCPSLPSMPVYHTTGTPNTLATPTDFQAQVISPGSVQLFWTDVSNNETGYEIMRSTTGAAGSFTVYKALGEDAIAYTDTGLASNTPYYYRIRAVNATAASPYTSSNLVVSTSIDTEAPTAPQNLTVVSKTINSVILSWSPSTDNNAVQSYYYSVNGGAYVSTGSTATTYMVTTTNGTTALTANTNYNFTVKAKDAKDASNNFSQPSNQVNAATVVEGLVYENTAVNVNDPLQVTATNTLYGINWLNVEHTGTVSTISLAPRAQDDYYDFKFSGYLYIPAGQNGTYNFRINSNEGAAFYLNTTSGTAITSMVPFNPASTGTNRRINNDVLVADGSVSTSSVYSVVLGNATGARFYPISLIYFERNGSDSLSLEYSGPATGNVYVSIPATALKSGIATTVTPPTQPLTPQALTQGPTSILLTWTHTLTTLKFEVYRSTDNVNFGIVGTTATNIKTYTDTNLTPGTTYYYYIKAINSTSGATMGTSLASTTVNATTSPDSTKPSAPDNVIVISNTYTNAALQWDASTDNIMVTGYKIFAGSELLGTSTSTFFTTTALEPGGSYEITVVAYDASNNLSDPSSVIYMSTPAAQTYYTVGSGNLELTSSWNTNVDGSGSAPAGFMSNGQYFVINRPTASLSNSWQIGGQISKVILEENVVLSLNNSLNGKISLEPNASIIINNVALPVFETLDPTSTVTFATYTSVPLATYGNLVLNGTGQKIIPAGMLEVKGNLQLNNGVDLKGSSSNGTTVKVSGNVTIGTAASTPTTPANLVALEFTDNTTHTINAGADLSFFKIKAAANNTVQFVPTSGIKKLILGTDNGGGIELASGSMLDLGNNDLQLRYDATVNPGNTTGRIAINHGDIDLTTASSSASHFYFSPAANAVDNFSLNATGGSITTVHEMMNIYDGLKITDGTLDASGQITIKSSSSASAGIREIEGEGEILGEVTTERYMAPKGRLYRYLSSPLSGITVENWQTYIPITGNFPNTSTGPGLTTNASMFYYTEPAYVAYPTVNQAPIQTGRGYAVFMREGVNPTTLITSGNPHQGDISFTSILTGGTGLSSNGWNLVGNPYASDVVWNLTGWTSSGIGDVISVSENLPNGQLQYRYWNRNGFGSGIPLENGKIPAGQAFWVQAATASPTLVIHESAKTTETASQNTEFYRTSGPTDLHYFSLAFTNGTREDMTFINFDAAGKNEYEKLKDGIKRPNSFFNLSTNSSDNIQLAMNDLSDAFCEKTIPVNIENAVAGTYTLKVVGLNAFHLANVKLVDNFLSQTHSLSGDMEFPVTITGETASYRNRFSLELTRPDVTSNLDVVTVKNVVCSTESIAEVSISNSQYGVEYAAYNDSSISLSEKVMGNGETIILKIPVSKLTTGKTNVVVQGAFPGGCVARSLDKITSITLSDIPAITVPAEVNGCIGGSTTITVTGTATNTYQWFDYVGNTSLPETSNTLSIENQSEIGYFKVTAVSKDGCVGASKNVLVRADFLSVPEISLGEGAILLAKSDLPVQWFFNGSLIEGATEQQLSIAAPGDYTVKTQNIYCARESAPFKVDLVTSTKQDDTFSLLVYPNPSETGTTTISGRAKSGSDLVVKVTDVTGKSFFDHLATPEDYTRGIRIHEYIPAGLYIVTVKQNDQTLRQKIIIR